MIKRGIPIEIVLEDTGLMRDQVENLDYLQNQPIALSKNLRLGLNHDILFSVSY